MQPDTRHQRGKINRCLISLKRVTRHSLGWWWQRRGRGGCIWCSGLEGAGRMFLLLAMLGGDAEGMWGSEQDTWRWGGCGTASTSTLMLGASPSGAAIPASPGHPSGLPPRPVLPLLASWGVIWGNHLHLPAAGRLLPARGGGGGPSPPSTTAHAGVSGRAPPSDCLSELPGIPVDIHGQACILFPSFN